ncbi:MAG: hypothetical protein HDKAJFGB_01530 [Anaerolineae bacterium]|nr:hypothetical protein [Anaerolineae bacterium]
MSFFAKLFSGGKASLPQASNPSDPHAWYLYVQCGKCGAPVAIRIDLRNDLSVDYETNGRYLRKEIMDSVCFQLMYAQVHFDSGGQVTSQTIERGKILDRAEYDAIKAAWDAPKNEK